MYAGMQKSKHRGHQDSDRSHAVGHESRNKVWFSKRSQFEAKSLTAVGEDGA